MCPSTLLLAMVGRCCPNEKVRVCHRRSTPCQGRRNSSGRVHVWYRFASTTYNMLVPCAAMLSLSFKRSNFSALCWMAKFASL